MQINFALQPQLLLGPYLRLQEFLLFCTAFQCRLYAKRTSATIWISKMQNKRQTGYKVSIKVLLTVTNIAKQQLKCSNFLGVTRTFECNGKRLYRFYSTVCSNLNRKIVQIDHILWAQIEQSSLDSIQIDHKTHRIPFSERSFEVNVGKQR